jgi:hypothetical protein
MSDAAGPRPGRVPESASFDVARVGPRRRGRQPAIVLGFVALLAAVVAIGVGGRTPPAPSGPPPVAAVSPGAAATPPEASATHAPPPNPGPTRALVIAGLGGPLELRIRRPAASIFVHGDVFAPNVTWVYISLQDATGDVEGFASVSVPGAAGPRSTEGPSLRFDIDVAIPSDLVGADVWVQAIAYDATGAVVGTTRIGIRPDGGPVNGPRGFR